MSDDPQPDPFTEYAVTVEGLGSVTIIDPQGEPGYRGRLADGRVTGWPAASGNPCPENAAADILDAITAPAEPVLTEAQIWEAKLAGSLVDPGTGIALKANRAARNDFIGQDVLLGNALAKGLLQPTDLRTIWDADNVAHELAVSDLRDLLLRYGVAWNAMFDEFAP